MGVQIFAKGAKDAMTKFGSLDTSQSETLKYGLASTGSKPLGDTDWNGSGMHANFSDGRMRDEGGEKLLSEIWKPRKEHQEAH